MINKKTCLNALRVLGDHLNDIVELVPKLAIEMGDEVAEVANINSRSQVAKSNLDCAEWNRIWGSLCYIRSL